MIAKDQTRQLSEWIKAMAAELGFAACGISRAEKLVNETERLCDWLLKGYHGEMAYMERNKDMRTDPQSVFEGAKSVISVLMNYYPQEKLAAENNYKIARYAYGRDYHEEIRERLNVLIKVLRAEAGEFNARAYTDSAPVLEKALAERAGLGWIGKNTCLIHPESGSFVFVGEILTDLALEYDTSKVNDLCGGCTRCMDACPTGAIIAPRVLDARRCISYLTIEYKGKLPQPERERFHDWIFGCDICQEVCPWNRHAKPHQVESFLPSQELRTMNKQTWQELTPEQFQRMFRGSAVKRAKFEGLRRNIQFLSETK